MIGMVLGDVENMSNTQVKIQRGMTRLLTAWRESVAGREQRLGWKVGFSMPADQQRLNLPSAMVGYLSRERSLASGQQYRASAASNLLVEPEVAILIGRDVPARAGADRAKAAIAAYTAALEMVDTTRSVNDDIEEILAGNMFHEAVVLADQRLPPNAFSREQLGLTLCVNGNEVRTLEQQRVPENFASLICTVADILAAHGEQLQSGDWIITGAAAKPVPIHAGDNVTLDMGFLGKLSLIIC